MKVTSYDWYPNCLKCSYSTDFFDSHHRIVVRISKYITGYAVLTYGVSSLADLTLRSPVWRRDPRLETIINIIIRTLGRVPG